MSIAFFRNILCHADLYYTSKNGGNNLHVYFFIEAQNCLSVGKKPNLQCLHEAVTSLPY